MASISPTQSDAQAALAAFIVAVLPGSASSAPAVFAGFISGTTLTIMSVKAGTVSAGLPLLGAAPGTVIIEQLSGTTGGVGTYQISPSQMIGDSETGATMSTGVSIYAGQQNRVSEPVNPFFVMMTPIPIERLSTNVDFSQDVKFTGQISSTILDVTAIDHGAIEVGASIFGSGIASGTSVIAFAGGSGGTGTYIIAPSQSVSSEMMSAGWKILTQNVKITVQCDFHSPDTTAGDFAQTVSTALRDEYGVSFFANLSAPQNGVVPLYADDPRQVPFENAESQFEWRWSLDVQLEFVQAIQLPQKYADSADLNIVDVTASYPP
jgi:hypothetical protein